MRQVEIDTGSPDFRTALSQLSAGDRLLLSGTIYTARDAAHKRICELLDSGEKLPFALEGAVIYYTGPTEAPPGMPIGSCGPTTSARMDGFAPRLYDLGVAATVGKGGRSGDVRASVAKNGAVYLLALGGCGALAAGCVKNSVVVGFSELGCEAVRRLEVRDFPLITGIDSRGNCLFDR